MDISLVPVKNLNLIESLIGEPMYFKYSCCKIRVRVKSLGRELTSSSCRISKSAYVCAFHATVHKANSMGNPTRKNTTANSQSESV